ncbi:uncharacterized protein N7483_011101 [Penicillium malachiteum]|uniref:uncharacterized protein n=1 Tax=Penicillium malachiteum TaxID=1324776 RepID=UPI0025468CB5|nr:uncharacterized protein N7483_011101 [Penicillium malachiteum]KAJ5713920.1 hypothetical protein N7483_011101 [Penicillium malachiteum]
MSDETQVLSALKLLCDTPHGTFKIHRDLSFQVLETLKLALSTTEHSTGSNNYQGGEMDPQTICHPTYSTSPNSKSPTSIEEAMSPTPIEERSDEGGSDEGQSDEGGSDEGQSDEGGSDEGESTVGRSDEGQSAEGESTEDQSNKGPHTNFINAVKTRLADLSEICRKTPSISAILAQMRLDAELLDEKIIFLQRGSSARALTDEDRLVRGLTQSFIAHNFTQWERSYGLKPRLEKIANAEAKGKKSCRGGKMASYLRDCGIQKKHHNMYRKGIQKGSNQILFRKSLEDLWRGAEKYATVPGVMALFSILEYVEFEKVPTVDLAQLAKCVDSSYGEVDIENTKAFSDWFGGMEREYDMIFNASALDDERSLGHETSCVDLTANSHELSTFSTVPTTAHVNQSSINYPNISINSHELSSFSTIPTFEHVNPCSINYPNMSINSHELSSFSTVPTFAQVDPCPINYPNVNINSHELSSISTYPNAVLDSHGLSARTGPGDSHQFPQDPNIFCLHSENSQDPRSSYSIFPETPRSSPSPMPNAISC